MDRPVPFWLNRLMMSGGKPRFPYAGLTAALAAGAIWLIWGHRFFPSQDGPSHLYNTWILLHWNDPGAIFQRFYTIDLTPVPNWLATALLGLLMPVFGPLAADRLLVTIVVLAMTAAWWYWMAAAGARNSPLLALGPLLSLNFLLYKGFYSFCLSLPLFLLAAGYALRHAARLQPKHSFVLWLILLPIYFAHIVTFGLALAFVMAVVVLRASRETRRILGLPAPLWWLSPLLLLVLSATIGLGSGRVVRWGPAMLARYFLRGEWLVSFNRAQIVVSTGLMILLTLLLLAALVRVARGTTILPGSPTLLAAAGAALVLYAVMPRGLAGGWYLSERLAMFPVLLLAPLAGRDLGKAASALTALAVAALTIGQIALLDGVHGRYDEALTAYTAPAGRVPRNAAILPLWWREPDPDLRVFPLMHAGGYYGILRNDVNLADYAGKTTYFQIRFREGIVMPPQAEIERNPSAIDIGRYAPSIDAVITWNMRSKAPDGLIRSYEEWYRPVVDEGRLMIFEKRAP